MSKLRLLVLSVLLTACTGPRPDLGRLYAMQANADGQPPVVVIHGMPGSRLVSRDAGREVWSGSTWKILFHDYRALTPAWVLVEEIGGDSVMRLWPDQVEQPLPGLDYDALMLEPGDGVVTRASLLARQELDPTVARHRYSFFPLGSAFFLCERHDALTGNINFRDNTLHVLLSADDPGR